MTDTQNTSRTKVRALTGIQPSGELHIGNYLGAVKNWIKMAHSHELYTSIVDYHAMTNPTSFDPTTLSQNTFELALGLLAAGLDGSKASLFVQSQLPEVAELTWIFQTQTPLGDLERMTQFKDKTARQHSILSGLLTYPVLQAADILILKAIDVPVGEDQIQHIELTREIARRFNMTFGEVFPEPKAVVPKVGGRIRGLDGKAKMSKSLGNTIALLEPSKEAWSKLRGAVTDPARLRRNDPGDPNMCNIFSLHKSFSTVSTIKMIASECRQAGIGCIDCKKFLFNGMENEFVPMREHADALRSKPSDVKDVLADGLARTQAVARETLAEARDKVGFYKR